MITITPAVHPVRYGKENDVIALTQLNFQFVSIDLIVELFGCCVIAVGKAIMLRAIVVDSNFGYGVETIIFEVASSFWVAQEGRSSINQNFAMDYRLKGKTRQLLTNGSKLTSVSAGKLTRAHYDY